MSNIAIARAACENPRELITDAVWQYDYGQILDVSVIEDLPAAFEVHFCNKGDTQTTTSIGQNGQVTVPDAYLLTGKYIYAYIYLHTGENDGETEYKVTMPVNARQYASHETPTPVQQSEIEELMAALTAGVEAAEGAAEHYPQITGGFGTGQNSPIPALLRRLFLRPQPLNASKAARGSQSRMQTGQRPRLSRMRVRTLTRSRIRLT